MTREELLKIAKPILFNTNMVRAILAERKTETRRVLKVRYKDDEIGFNIITNAHTGEFVRVTKYDEMESEYDDWGRLRIVSLPYSLGDVLYVRETWYKDAGRYLYRANYTDNEKFYINGREVPIKWSPSIHMPKEAARIFLKITGVRVERLQDITIQGILEEGIIVEVSDLKEYRNKAIKLYSELWNSTIPKKRLDIYGWGANPWVVVGEFERLEVE